MINCKKLVLLILGMTVIGFSSCTKTGPDGPEGQQGEKGQQGERGEKGLTGKPGEAGYSGMIRSEWTSVQFVQTDNSWIGVIDAPMITEEVLNMAEVEVYGKDDDGNIHELNFFMGDGVDNNTYLTVKIDIGRISLLGNFDPSSYSFRYSILMGGDKISLAPTPPLH